MKKAKVVPNEGRRQETHGFGGGMLEKGIWEMKGGWDLQMGVRRSHRNSDWIDQLTLKEGPLGAG